MKRMSPTRALVCALFPLAIACAGSDDAWTEGAQLDDAPPDAESIGSMKQALEAESEPEERGAWPRSDFLDSSGSRAAWPRSEPLDSSENKANWPRSEPLGADDERANWPQSEYLDESGDPTSWLRSEQLDLSSSKEPSGDDETSRWPISEIPMGESGTTSASAPDDDAREPNVSTARWPMHETPQSESEGATTSTSADEASDPVPASKARWPIADPAEF